MKFVRVNDDYAAELKKVDKRVQYIDKTLDKDNKPFLGVLFMQGDIEYFVPLSSPKEKHKKMKNSKDFHKITRYNKKYKSEKLLSVLNFNNMIPVSPQLYTEIDFSKEKDEYLLKNEFRFCLSNAAVLKNKAQALYQRYKENSLTENEKARTCDFTKLEETLENYLKKLNEQSNNLTTPSEAPAEASQATPFNSVQQEQQQPSPQLLNMLQNMYEPKSSAQSNDNAASSKNDFVND